MECRWIMLASLGWHHVIVRRLHRKCILPEVLDCSQAVLVPRIQLCPSDPTIPFNPCRRRFTIKIAFAVIVRLKGRLLTVLHYIYRRLFFPKASSACPFPDPLHCTVSLLQLLKGFDSVQEMIHRWHQALYIVAEHCWYNRESDCWRQLRAAWDRNSEISLLNFHWGNRWIQKSLSGKDG
jgi:hypothetical protein